MSTFDMVPPIFSAPLAALPPAAYKVYAGLRAIADWRDGTCRPVQHRLARQLHMNPRTFAGGLRALKSRHLIRLAGSAGAPLWVQVLDPITPQGPPAAWPEPAGVPEASPTPTPQPSPADTCAETPQEAPEATCAETAEVAPEPVQKVQRTSAETAQHSRPDPGRPDPPKPPRRGEGSGEPHPLGVRGATRPAGPPVSRPDPRGLPPQHSDPLLLRVRALPRATQETLYAQARALLILEGTPQFALVAPSIETRVLALVAADPQVWGVTTGGDGHGTAREPRGCPLLTF